MPESYFPDKFAPDSCNPESAFERPAWSDQRGDTIELLESVEQNLCQVQFPAKNNFAVQCLLGWYTRLGSVAAGLAKSLEINASPP